MSLFKCVHVRRARFQPRHSASCMNRRLGGRRALLEYDFSADQLLALEIIYWTLSSFSFLGGLFVVVSFCSCSEVQRHDRCAIDS